MKERPILFTGVMVRALLGGTKTQTRRLIKPQPTPLGADVVRVPSDNGWEWPCAAGKTMVNLYEARSLGPYGWRGDCLWVRETWAYYGGPEYLYQREPAACIYRADQVGIEERHGDDRWRPSIHMPRWASRLTLEITNVRVQRLQEISEDDAKAEGAAFTCQLCGNDLDDVEGAAVHYGCDADSSEEIEIDGKTGPVASHREGYRRLWNDINGAGTWDANPWVWAISFKRAEAIAS